MRELKAKRGGVPKGFFLKTWLGGVGGWVGGGEKKRAKKKWEEEEEDKPTIGGTIYLETKFWKEMMDKWQEQKEPKNKNKTEGN